MDWELGQRSAQAASAGGAASQRVTHLGRHLWPVTHANGATHGVSLSAARACPAWEPTPKRPTQPDPVSHGRAKSRDVGGTAARPPCRGATAAGATEGGERPRRPGGGACVGRGHALRGHWRGFLPSWQLEGLTSRVWPWPEPDTAQDTSRPSRSGPRPLPRPQLPALGPQPGYATRRDVDLTRPRPQRPAQTARIDRRGRVLARGADIANPLPRADA